MRVWFALVLVGLLVLAGCGDGDDSAGTTGPGDTDAGTDVGMDVAVDGGDTDGSMDVAVDGGDTDGSDAGCVRALDCESGVCTEGVCAEPTCDDGIQNQDETDVDCGGATCPSCP